MKAYCVHEAKKGVTMTGKLSVRKLKNGAKLVMGKCSSCGHKISKIVSGSTKV